MTNSRGAASASKLLHALRRRKRYRPHKSLQFVHSYVADKVSEDEKLHGGGLGQLRAEEGCHAWHGPQRVLLHLLQLLLRLLARSGPGFDLPVYQPFGVGIRGGQPGELLTDLHSPQYVLSDPDHVFLLRLLPAGV